MTQVSKGFHGWTAESEFPKLDGQVVRISTMKRSTGWLVTSVTVGRRNGPFFEYKLFDDFNKNLLVEKVRCTEKNVRQQHDSIVKNEELLESLFEDITNHYSAQEEFA